jgi:hypothetical protein
MKMTAVLHALSNLSKTLGNNNNGSKKHVKDTFSLPKTVCNRHKEGHKIF